METATMKPRSTYSKTGFRNSKAPYIYDYLPKGEEMFINSDGYIVVEQRRQKIEQEDTVKISVSHIYDKFIDFQQKFEKKLIPKINIFEDININVLRFYTYLSARVCLLTNPEKLSAELTEDQSVLFTVIYQNSKNAYIELFFEPDLNSPVQSNVFIYENKKSTYAFGGEFVICLKNFLEQTHLDIELLKPIFLPIFD